MHLFVHTLDTTLKNWYIELEVHIGIGDWEELKRNFKVTFSFENNNLLIDSTLQVIKNNIFQTKVLMYNTPRVTTRVYEVFHCYNVVEENQEDEYPRKFQIPKNEGEHAIEGLELESTI